MEHDKDKASQDSGGWRARMARLQEGASATREALPQKSSGATPPEDKGKRLATLHRDGEEIRISWQEYQGRPFLNVRFWTCDTAGRWWPDKARGFTVRLRELADFADGVAAALAEAEAHAERERGSSSP